MKHTSFSLTRLVLFLLLISIFGANTARSTIIHVPEDQPTIQDGINTASEGDTVLVQPGTYVETINFDGKNIVVGSLFLTTQNPSYITETIIDGAQQGSVITFENSETSTTVLTGFTITNGSGTMGIFCYGGGIYCANASEPTITHNIITNNEVGYGGGIHCMGGSSPIITNNTIKENIALSAYDEGWGGGIACMESSHPIISNNIIEENVTNYAGGIFCITGSNPTITDNDISNNIAYEGGGILCVNSSPDIIGNTITNNMANDGSGGGITCSISAAPNISNNTITNNTASHGGGIYCVFESNPNISDNLIKYNSSDQDGGGIMCILSNPTITGNTIMNNYSQYSGGGINCMDASPVITHNIIAGNMAYLTGGALACPINAYPVLINNTIVNNTAENPGGGIYCSDATANPIVLNCIFWNNSPEQICGSASVVAYSNVQGGWQGENNIDVNPLFVDPESDFHLQENSPCIDAGTAYFELNGEIILDLHPDEYIGEAPDMGAVEYDPESAILPAQYEITTPQKVTLHSAYPNPFNPQTTIQFDVPVASQINLQIYNAQGQLVRTLANNQKKAGHHRVIWNGKDEQGNAVDSGLYFYKLTVDNKYSDVKPMTLLK